MSELLDKQEEVKQRAYAEAMRYMQNAKDTLQKAHKEDGYYKDKKYVRSSCGIAYLGALVALDAWLTLKGVELPKKGKHKSIEFYTMHVSALDGKLLNDLHTIYRILHIEGYYEGIRKANIIKEGFDTACDIIERIKPNHPVSWEEIKKPSPFNGLLSFLASLLS
jgi:hypothetical protein